MNAQNGPTRVLVACRSRLSNDVLSATLAGEELEVVGTTTQHEELTDWLESSAVDVVVIETGQSTRPALETTRRLKDRFSQVEILVFGLHRTRDIVAFVEAGASGYVLRNQSLDDLTATAQALRQKLSPCSPRLAASVVSRMRELAAQEPQHVDAVGRLTSRESEVLRLLALGLSNQEIATHLGISLSTAKNHVHNLLGKLEAKDRHEAAAAAVNAGLV